MDPSEAAVAQAASTASPGASSASARPADTQRAAPFSNTITTAPSSSSLSPTTTKANSSSATSTDLLFSSAGRPEPPIGVSRSITTTTDTRSPAVSAAEIVLQDTHGRQRHKGNKQLSTASPNTAIKNHLPKYNRGPRKGQGVNVGGALVEVKSNCKISHTFSSVPSPPADGTHRVFSMLEIAKHNRANDCWLVVKGRVYDVTTMVAQHPGSGRAILRHAGQVCDEDFEFHSKAARTFWKKHYCIGYVKGSEPQPLFSSCCVM